MTEEKTREIPLTKGYVALVSEGDYERVMEFKWQANPLGKTVYGRRNIRKDDGSRTSQMLHRFILSDPVGVHVDHIDGNGLNNTRSNLRLATPSQNQFNRTVQTNSTCGFKGVTWESGKWRARIKIQGKRINLGRFDDAEIAAHAYDVAALELQGEFAVLNFPKERHD